MIECGCGAKEHKRGGSENEKTVHKWIHLGKNIFFSNENDRDRAPAAWRAKKDAKRNRRTKMNRRYFSGFI